MLVLYVLNCFTFDNSIFCLAASFTSVEFPVAYPCLIIVLSKTA